MRKMRRLKYRHATGWLWGRHLNYLVHFSNKGAAGNDGILHRPDGHINHRGSEKRGWLAFRPATSMWIWTQTPKAATSNHRSCSSQRSATMVWQWLYIRNRFPQSLATSWNRMGDCPVSSRRKTLTAALRHGQRWPLQILITDGVVWCQFP